jgi:hypothetical protein
MHVLRVLILLLKGNSELILGDGVHDPNPFRLGVVLGQQEVSQL